MDNQTLKIFETIALALHQRFCVDLLRVELVLNFEGDIDIEISALAFYPYPLLSGLALKRSQNPLDNSCSLSPSHALRYLDSLQSESTTGANADHPVEPTVDKKPRLPHDQPQ